MENEYKSIEEKTCEKIHPFSSKLTYSLDSKLPPSLKRVGDFLNYGIMGIYSGAVSFFRTPTLIRKFFNNQTILDKKEVSFYDGDGVKKCGLSMGISVGLVSTVSILAESIKNENYIPLAIFGVTNLLSGIYETSRLKKSREERLEILAQSTKEKKDRLDRIECSKGMIHFGSHNVEHLHK